MSLKLVEAQVGREPALLELFSKFTYIVYILFTYQNISTIYIYIYKYILANTNTIKNYRFAS